jgi:pimeloyl-ACP methyl ester carboxylesterase
MEKGGRDMSNANPEVRSSILKVPGAHLYYEVYGSGPVLLMIPGGPADAGFFGALARRLAGSYTCVPYDPRGNSRSVLDGPPEDQDMDVHAADAAQLLAALTSEPAFVLGSSGGAQIGLNLAARYPRQVHTLVAHEPPCIQLLPDTAELRAFKDGVYETYCAQGPRAAMQRFAAGAGLGGPPKPDNAAPPPPPPQELREAFGRINGNLDYFFAHGFKPISLYVPDVDALCSGSPRIVVGVGETSTGQLAHRSALALANLLDVAPVYFPGGHGGYNDQPAAFPEKLHQVLSRTNLP